MPGRGSFRIFDGPAELARAAAELFALRVAAVAAERGQFTVALAGGSTPRALYTLLASESEPYRARLPWEKIQFYWGDERHVPPDHSDSNYRMAREAMFSKAPVPEANIHRIESENPDAHAAAAAYELTLRATLGLRAGQLPRFDLVLLGMGPDGHTASLFPGTDALGEMRRLVAAPWVEKFKTCRITLTVPVINNAAVVALLVSGSEKAETLRAVFEEPATEGPPRFPVQLIRPTSGELIWLLDRDAARLLDP